MEHPLSNDLTSILHLPDDCLAIIFRFLHGSSNRESFGLTCHRWLSIQNRSRRSLQFQCSFNFLSLGSLSHSNPVVYSHHLQRLLARFHHLQSLSLSGCTELPDTGLTGLQSYGSHLQTLNLDCCFRITDSGLTHVANGCPSLTAISLYRCNISDDGLLTLANGCTSLAHINLSYCSLVSDLGLKAISISCRRLQAIRISFCNGVNGTGLEGCSPTLAYVDAECCKLGPDGIKGIVSGGGVEYLNLLATKWYLGPDALASIGIGLATKLKVLDLRMCRGDVGDESVASIAKGCPLLQEWSLALCHGVGLSGWESIGKNCNKLEKLHVNQCRNLCDRGLQALREGCGRLSVLYINRCPKLSSTALELFKLYRGTVEIKAETVLSIGPKWVIR